MPGISRVAARPPWGDLPREVVLEHRRQKFVLATAEIARRSGVEAVTASELCRSARSARATYYDLFGTTSEALRFSFATAFERTIGQVQAAGTRPGPGPAVAGQAIEELLNAAAREPALAELCLCHAAGRPVESEGSEFSAAVDVLAPILERARVAARQRLGAAYQEPPAIAEEVLAAGVLSLVRDRLLAGRGAQLPEQKDELLGLVWRGLGVDKETGAVL